MGCRYDVIVERPPHRPFQSDADNPVPVMIPAVPLTGYDWTYRPQHLLLLWKANAEAQGLASAICLVLYEILDELPATILDSPSRCQVIRGCGELHISKAALSGERQGWSKADISA